MLTAPGGFFVANFLPAIFPLDIAWNPPYSSVEIGMELPMYLCLGGGCYFRVDSCRVRRGIARE